MNKFSRSRDSRFKIIKSEQDGCFTVCLIKDCDKGIFQTVAINFYSHGDGVWHSELTPLDDTARKTVLIEHYMDNLAEIHNALKAHAKEGIDVKSKEVVSNKNVLADDQISESMFLSTPVQQITVIPDLINFTDKLFVMKDADILRDIQIAGFTIYPCSVKPQYREFYQHDIIYFKGLAMYRSIVCTGDPETCIPSKPKNYKKQVSECKLVRKNLQQFFVV
jgi:hypothetical protein